MTTQMIRNETESLPDGNELIVEVHEDTTLKGFGHKVMLTLQGKESGIAMGRANLGQVFRQLTRQRAEWFVDAILDVVRRPDEVSADGTLRARLLAIEAERARPEAMQRVPAPVKGRAANQTAVTGVELDPFGRKDLAEKLRQIADLIETRDPRIVVQQCDIEPIRGGGQTIALRVIKR